VRVERTTHLEATPERVYEVVMDPRCLAQWVSIHRELVDAPPGDLKQGSELTQKLKLAGQTFKVAWEVVENDPAKRVVWNGRGPFGSKAKVVYEFGANGEGTDFRYTNEYDLPGGVAGRMAGTAVKRVTGKEVDKSLEQLKKFVEQ
jgi:carbon monoxide dehydrogenase subunit G